MFVGNNYKPAHARSPIWLGGSALHGARHHLLPTNSPGP